MSSIGSLFQIIRERNKVKQDLKKTERNSENCNWVFARIRLYKNMINIGCGADAENAIEIISKLKPVIDHNIKLINPNYSGCSITLIDGGHVDVSDLDGFESEVLWFLVGYLIHSGWFIQKRQLEGQDKKRPVIDLLYDWNYSYAEFNGRVDELKN